MIDPFIAAVRNAVSQQNWLAALATALIVPDICGFLEGRVEGTGARYAAWFEQYVQPRYTSRPGNMFDHVFLSGADCYALRCALLHEGSDQIVNQRARQALDRFEFVTPLPNGINRHNNQSGKRLQLQVDFFCDDICAGAAAWQNSPAARTSEAHLRARSLIVIN